MVLAIVLGSLLGLAALVAVAGIVLIPAALLARFLGRVDTVEREPAVARRATRELSGPPIWQAHPGA